MTKIKKSTNDRRAVVSRNSITESQQTPIIDTDRLVRDTILAEAVSKITDITSHDDLQTKIQKVSEEMSLEPDEVDELSSRFSSSDMPVPMSDPGNTIYFDSEEDMNQAIGMLMLKKVAWSAKGVESEDYFVSFPDKDTLLKAIDVIKRRWDMVDSSQRTVGLIQFDNLKDYHKVLDFIMKSNMLVTFGDPIASMGEDYDVETSKTKSKESTLSTFDGSLLAKNKSSDEDPDPVENPMDRIASVRKIWK